MICPGAVTGEGRELIEELLRANPVCGPVLAAGDRHEVQILYTQVDRDAQNRPPFYPPCLRR